MSMQVENEDESNDLDAVLAMVTKLARISAGGSFIFRGEPERFPKVSSSLYRQYEEIEAEQFNIKTVQSEILHEARKYTSESDEFEILAQLQHYGGKTNLIDFTADYLVALFFSCDGSPNEDGRVILLRKSGEMSPFIKEPKDTNNRVVAQKSVFVQPPDGYVEPDIEVVISKQTKAAVLAHLKDAHGISNETIYKDIFGFIRYQDVHRSAYTEFYRGVSSQLRGEFEAAIVQYSESIRLNPQHPATYYNRGNAYFYKGQFDHAISDFNRAIDLSPNFADVYVNRGVAFHEKGDIRSAILDYDRALELEPNSTNALSNRGSAYSDKGLPSLAMRDHNKAIELEPGNASCYVNRGFAYNREGAHGLAIEDYNMALELDPGKTKARYNRGEAWLCLAEWEKAKSDLTTAQDKGLDIAAEFHSDYRNVSHFEQKHSVEIPEDIAEMLGG